MHLPDCFLDTKTAALSACAAATGISVALRRVRVSLGPRQTPRLGLAAAFVFVAQMLNFPILGGTSGHLIGGVMAAVLLGPSAAILVMTCVLIVQCLMFADGGLLALGANLFNMAIVNVCGGWFTFRLVKAMCRSRSHPEGETLDDRSTVFAAAFAAWVGTVLASISCAGQLALSQTAPWSVTFSAMLNVHMLIGIGEGLATGLIVMAVRRTRPELIISANEAKSAPVMGYVPYGLLLCFGLAVFVAPFACPWPDGLESVAKSLGFLRESPQTFKAPMADYHFPWASATTATAVAALIGTVVAFSAAYALARVLAPRLISNKSEPHNSKAT